jgi:hypothetical protein
MRALVPWPSIEDGHFSARGPWGPEPPFWYRCRYCNADTDLFCEGATKISEGHDVCLQHLCAICADIIPGPSVIGDVLMVFCPSCDVIMEG